MGNSTQEINSFIHFIKHTDFIFIKEMDTLIPSPSQSADLPLRPRDSRHWAFWGRLDVYSLRSSLFLQQPYSNFKKVMNRGYAKILWSSDSHSLAFTLIRERILSFHEAVRESFP